MVDGWTLNNLATSAADFSPLATIRRASSFCSWLSLLRRPPIRPFCLATSRPARVLSRVIARSNSANAPSICIIIRPAGVVVSIASVMLLFSFTLLLIINGLQAWTAKRTGRDR